MQHILKLHTHKYAYCTFIQCMQLINPMCVYFLFICSTRVSNELGAGNAKAARTATLAVMFLAVAEACIISTILFVNRRIFGYTFSNDKEVVDYVTEFAPLVCVSLILDGLQGVLSGQLFKISLSLF